MNNTSYNSLAAETAAWLISQIPDSLVPRVALVTGSGLSALADHTEVVATFSTADIPHYPRSTVEGHPGRLSVGKLANTPVLVMQGRIHFYEGYPIQAVAFPIRMMQALGVQTVILTNAAGGLEQSWDAGDIMLISDHISFVGLAGNNPLVGPNDNRLGPRFPSLSNIYTPRLRKMALETASALGLSLREGVYVNVSGPSFETPAELRFLHMIGGHAVGMSTAPEAIVAAHAGIEVLGFSLLTNKALLNPTEDDTVSHEEVLEVGNQAAPRLVQIIEALLPQLK